MKEKKQLPSLSKIANTFCLLSLLIEKPLSPINKEVEKCPDLLVALLKL